MIVLRMVVLRTKPNIDHFPNRDHWHFSQHPMPSPHDSTALATVPYFEHRPPRSSHQQRCRFVLPMVLLTLMSLVLPGCQKQKAIPARLVQSLPARTNGKIIRAWGGDNFECGHRTQLHFFFIIGVDCPELGQPFYEEAKQHLLKTSQGQTIEMEVLDYDELKREIGHVWIINQAGQRINFGIELLEQGLAWFDQNEFEGADRYREAVKIAQDKKIGIWSQPDPIPPWEFWQRQVQSLRAQN